MHVVDNFKAENVTPVINAIWDMLLGNDKEGTCCICGKHYDNYGNNAKPYKEGRCCDECNDKRVLPMRHTMMKCGMPFVK